MVGTWLMVTVVLANGYAGTLFSFLSVAKLEPIINSLEELANSKDVQLIIQDRVDLALRFFESSINHSEYRNEQSINLSRL